jgi:hypothetical protein
MPSVIDDYQTPKGFVTRAEKQVRYISLSDLSSCAVSQQEIFLEIYGSTGVIQKISSHPAAPNTGIVGKKKKKKPRPAVTIPPALLVRLTTCSAHISTRRRRRSRSCTRHLALTASYT